MGEGVGEAGLLVAGDAVDRGSEGDGDGDRDGKGDVAEGDGFGERGLLVRGAGVAGGRVSAGLAERARLGCLMCWAAGVTWTESGRTHR